jgi:hypothetical protein
MAVLAFAVFASGAMITAPVFAGGTTENIIVYDNREKILKIREISFSSDYTSMSVLVENLATSAEFRVEHEVNTGDTVNEYMEVTATDGMGAVSETVHIENPFYAPEPVEAEAVPVTGSLSVSGGNGDGEEVIPITAENESGKENGGFSTSGWASVVDNAESGDKEFFIVKSDTGNEFYVMIDREGGNENVYFLNAVTEWDLLGLTKEYEVPNNLDPNGELNAAVTAASQAPGTQTAPPTEAAADEAPAEPKEQGGIGIFGLILLIVFAGAVGAYFYFFKFKRRNSGQAKDEYLPDDYGEYEDEDEDEEETGETEDEEYDEEYEDEDGFPTEAEKTAEAPPPERGRDPVSERESNPSPKTGNPKTDAGFSDGEGFTDGDVSDGDYSDADDYGGEVDEDDVLGGLEGGDDEDEDNTV